MVDIKLVRSNPDLVKEAVRKRNKDMDEMIDQIIVIDAQRRETASQVETLKAEQNQASREIPRIKKEGGDVSAIMARMKEIVEEVKAGDAKLSALEEQQKDLLLSLPNIPDADVVAGGKENNAVLHYFKEKPVFDFVPKNHVRAVRVAGHD